MLKLAREKARQFGVEDRIVHRCLGFDDLEQLSLPQVDLVLSNFGGLNCIDEGHLDRLVDPIASALKPGGRFIAVVMPDRCLAETLHFFFRGQWKEAFRRGRLEPVWAGLSGTGAVTWYHAPQRLAHLFSRRFRVMNIRPVGLFVPPTYLEHRFGHRTALLERLARWDAWFARWRWTARYADHYLVDLERTR
jgi:SAM-dependent methyltransferase